MRLSFILLLILPVVAGPLASSEAQQMVRLPLIDSASFASDSSFSRSVNEFLESTEQSGSWAYDSQYRAALTHKGDTVQFRVIVLRRIDDPWVSDIRAAIESYCFAHLDGTAAWCVLGAAHSARQTLGTKTVAELVHERSGGAVTHCALSLTVNTRGEIDPQWIVTVTDKRRLLINADSGEVREIPGLQ